MATSLNSVFFTLVNNSVIFFTLAMDLAIFLEVHCGFYFSSCVLNLANIWPVFPYIYQFIS